ncbi:S8/S53 family peptidase [Streptomyces sp. SM12]|uniref:S8 family peptidase n=1 Tax=Streptomyces sp. SM12 TaxID=1071602 RepID=UPI000CD5336F|nr:S8/S53 family peptidase [Streptomyces sp. SM12]
MEPAAASTMLAWDPVEGAEGYRVGVNGASTDLPADLCGETVCEVSVAAGAMGLTPGADLGVASLNGEGQPGESVMVNEAWPPRAEELVDVPDVWQVAVVRYERERPVYEMHEAATERDAEQLRDGFAEDPDVAVAEVASLVANQQFDEDYIDAGAHAWQARAMRYDLLPGDPPGSGVRVALVETGAVDVSHPSVSGAVSERIELSGAAPDEVVDDHATMTASLLVGAPGAGPVPGAAPGVDLIGVSGTTTSGDLAAGIVDAVDADVDIISMSAGMVDCSRSDYTRCESYKVVKPAIDYAERSGVLVVASAGNHACYAGDDEQGKPYDERLLVPAGMDTVISVGGHERDGERWECSPRDADITAPAVGLLVATVGGGYTIADGTSFATPIVSGIFAAMLAERPEMTPAELRAELGQWKTAHGGLDVVPALSAVGVVDPGEEGVYPFILGWAWDDKSPQKQEIYSWGLDERLRQLTTGFYSTNAPWRRHPAASTATRHVPFGAVYGTLRTAGDTPQVEAEWGHDWHHGTGHTDDRGHHGDRPGWGASCPGYARYLTKPHLGWVWDLPVSAEVVDVDTSVDPPEAELIISLGTGATSGRAGGLPSVRQVGESLDECAGYIAETPARDRDLSYAEFKTLYDEYFELTEYLTHSLVKAGPFTIRMKLGGIGAFEVPGTDGLYLRYNASNLRHRLPWRDEQQWRQENPEAWEAFTKENPPVTR